MLNYKTLIIDISFLNNALDLGYYPYKKLSKKFNKEDGAISLTTVEEEDPEMETLISKIKIATIKSAIFGAYSVFAELVGLGGMSVAVQEVGQVIVNNPIGIAIGSTIVFFFAFFTKLKMELQINGPPDS